jgi:hypothetical protein
MHVSRAPLLLKESGNLLALAIGVACMHPPKKAGRSKRPVYRCLYRMGYRNLRHGTAGTQPWQRGDSLEGRGEGGQAGIPVQRRGIGA